jgi:hypothetical protein
MSWSWSRMGVEFTVEDLGDQVFRDPEQVLVSRS